MRQVRQGAGLWGVPESLDDDRLDSRAARQVSQGAGLWGVPESLDDGSPDTHLLLGCETGEQVGRVVGSAQPTR